MINLNDYEIAEEVKTIRISRICPECGGEMLPNGKVILIHPKEYEHICNKCGLELIYPRVYPEIVFENE